MIGTVMAELNVVQFPPRCGDVSAMLRNLADEIDGGEYGSDPSVVLVINGTPFSVRGYGKVDGLQAVGILHLASTYLTKTTLEEMELD
jgi:hypothetical protein